MVVVDISFSKLQKMVGKKFTKKQLEENLFELGAELEHGAGDEIRIDITAERPDLVSIQGIARLLRAYYGLKNPTYKANKPEKNFKVKVDKSVDNIRPVTVCAIIKNLKFDDDKIKEIIWVQEKLHATFGRNRKKIAIGIYPLEHITLPIFYKADSPQKIKFRPLEANREMTGKEILEKHPVGKAYAHLIKDLDKYAYFIDSKNNILSMPPIINSEKTGRVTENTKEVFIECSGHNFTALSHILNILCYLLQDMGGEIYSVEIDYPNKKIITPLFSPEKRKISQKFVKDMLGEDIDTKTIAKCLQKTMHKVTKVEKESVSFEVPPIRADIWHDVDIADDVLRGYGVNKIKPTIPNVATTGNVLYENKMKKTITELMVGLGFQEIFTLSLTNKEDQYIKMNVPVKNHIPLGSTVEQSISMVRTDLLPEAMKLLMNNRNKEYPQKIFEISHVVEPNKKADVRSNNVLHMSCLIADTRANFTEIKQQFDRLMKLIGVKYEGKEVEHPSFISGRVAKATVNGVDVAYFGEINPQVITNFGLEMPVSGFELNLTELFKEMKLENKIIRKL